MRRTILVSSFRGYAIVILVLGLLSPLLIFGGLRPVIRSLALEDLATTTYAVRSALSESILSGDMERTDSLARSLQAETGARITVIAPDGRVLVDTDADPLAMESHRTRTEVIAALESGEGTAIRNSATLGTAMLYAAVTLKQGDTVLAVVRSSVPFRHLDSIVGGIASRMALLAAIAVALSALIAWIFSRSLAVPVRRLADGLAWMQAGDYGVRAEPSRIRELDDLAKGFNNAAERTGGLISDLSERTSQFEAILDSSSGPLAVLDRQGRFVFANDAFRALGASDDLSGRDYREVIASSEIQSLLRKALEAPGSGQDRVSKDGRTWAASWTVVAGHEQVVLGMADITDAVNLAAVKRDFAVNVAHELRTPLTAIKGFAETLSEHADDEERKYLDIILRNAERLISLVRDVQALAEMERPGYELEAEEVDLRALLGPVIELFRPAAKEKGLELALEPGSSVLVSGDPYRLEQLAINLLDNAIKYTDKGSVRLSVSEDEGQALLEVSDTGQGIPEADIPRLCERFYVVDRSRSRHLGGTGLGLAIVKHIVMLHSGALGIRSEVGKGSTFFVRFPLFTGPSPS
jgi:two-component system, OmpR family, phosphate regulon sensor histidine kinase PhoR